MRHLAVATLVALMCATASGHDYTDGHQMTLQQLDRNLRGAGDSESPRISEPRQHVMPQEKSETVTNDETIIEKIEGLFGRSSAGPDFDVVSQHVAVGDAPKSKASVASMPINVRQGTLEGLQTNDPYLTLCSLFNCTLAKGEIFNTTPVTNMFTVQTFPPVALPTVAPVPVPSVNVTNATTSTSVTNATTSAITMNATTIPPPGAPNATSPPVAIPVGNINAMTNTTTMLSPGATNTTMPVNLTVLPGVSNSTSKAPTVAVNLSVAPASTNSTVLITTAAPTTSTANIPPTFSPASTRAPGVVSVSTMAPATASSALPTLSATPVNSTITLCKRKSIVVNDKIRVSYIARGMNKKTGMPGKIRVIFVYAGIGYVALGFSKDGKMDPTSQAVIGVGKGDVKKYNLVSKSLSGIVLSPRQTLTNTTFRQNATHTTMIFSKLIMEDDEVPIKVGGYEATNVIWAVGASNTLGYHAARGSIPITFQKCKSAPAAPLNTTQAQAVFNPTTSTTIAPTLVASVAPASAAPISQAPTIVPTVSVTIAPLTLSKATQAPTIVAASATLAAAVAPASAAPISQAPTIVPPVSVTTAPLTLSKATQAPTIVASLSVTASPVAASKPASTLLPIIGTITASVATSAPAQSPTVAAGAVAVDCSKYQHTVKLNDLVSFSYVVRVVDKSISESTLSVEVVYNGLGYIALGFSEDGNMDPNSQAVIGVGPGDIKKYSLLSKARSGIREAALQTLTNTSFVQTATQTTMTFTKRLVEQDEVPVSLIAPTNVIWAIGNSNQLDYHAARGTLPMIFESCGGSVPSVKAESVN